MLVPPLPDEQEFDNPQQQRNKGKGISTSKTEVFDNLIPESHQSGTNLLSDADKEKAVGVYKVNASSSESQKPKYPSYKKKKSFPWKFTRKHKYTMAFIVGHILSPFLWLATPTPIGGWMGILCLAAELLPKVPSDVLDENEILQYVDLFKSDPIKAVLFGSVVGVAQMSL